MRKFLILLVFSVTYCFGQQKDVKVTTYAGDVFTVAESPAMFPGGLNTFRQLVAENFRTKKVAGKGKETCEITFVVERDGTLSNIVASGNNESFNKEAIRAVSKIKTKWQPAKLNDYLVRYRYRVPLTLTFE